MPVKQSEKKDTKEVTSNKVNNKESTNKKDTVKETATKDVPDKKITKEVITNKVVEPPSKEVKGKTIKPVKQEVKVEDVIEDDEEEEEDDDEDDKNEDIKKKEKKPKKTFKEVLIEFENANEEINQKTVEINEAEKILKSLKTDKEKLERNRNKIALQFDKAHEDDVSKAAKDRPSKRNGNPNGGFNRKYKVPAPVVKFCGLEDGLEMNYPEIMSILNDKFKDGKMKEGQNTILNAEAAKIFKKEKGYTIKFGEIMTFIKEMIEAETPVKTDTTVKI